jgi:hypothetical protein
VFLAGQTGTGETIEDQTEDALGKVDRGARGIVGAFSAGEQLADHLGR